LTAPNLHHRAKVFLQTVARVMPSDIDRLAAEFAWLIDDALERAAIEVERGEHHTVAPRIRATKLRRLDKGKTAHELGEKAEANVRLLTEAIAFCAEVGWTPASVETLKRTADELGGGL